jgi:predicted PurR-regulated permease PerM
MMNGPSAEEDGPNPGVPVLDEVVAASADEQVTHSERPEWIDHFVWQSLWKVVVVGLATTAIVWAAWQMRQLLLLVTVSLFFALAMIPAVTHMHRRWGWRRGAAVGVMYAGLAIFVVALVSVLIPGIVEFADQVRTSGSGWVDQFNDWAQRNLDSRFIDPTTAAEAASTTGTSLTEWAENVLGLASSGIGFVFNLATIAVFTFYFAADAPRIERALLSRMPPHRQQKWGWVWDTAVEQTGGYFYSRLVLMAINGILFFGAMALVGMPVVYALPLSVFQAFMAEFIPVVGTYIGAAVPIVVTLAVQGFGAAVVLLVWTVVYQQLENFFLSPRLAAKTMTINGAVAFGAALAGAALAGPIGAFMAPVGAALITSIGSNSGKVYDVVYRSKYEEPLGDGEEVGSDVTGISMGS